MFLGSNRTKEGYASKEYPHATTVQFQEKIRNMI